MDWNDNKLSSLSILMQVHAFASVTFNSLHKFLQLKAGIEMQQMVWEGMDMETGYLVKGAMDSSWEKLL